MQNYISYATAFIMLITSSSSKGSDSKSSSDDSEVEDLLEPYDMNTVCILDTMNFDHFIN